MCVFFAVVVAVVCLVLYGKERFPSSSQQQPPLRKRACTQRKLSNFCGRMLPVLERLSGRVYNIGFVGGGGGSSLDRQKISQHTEGWNYTFITSNVQQLNKDRLA